MHVLVTGSSGLIGSEAVVLFDKLGFRITGVDNNMRSDFFGPKGDTSWNRKRLESTCKHFTHQTLDIRDRAAVESLFKSNKFGLIIHAAAQPSHDLAAQRPFDDFDVNAVGTLNLLENTRRHCPDAVFIHMSTNKVYGDGPNHIRLKELPTRWEYDDPNFTNGIGEEFPVDRCLHSLFGVSKLAGDVMAQEYGRYFGLKTGVFRGGCLTGPQHSGVELHGFLNYLVAIALRQGPYTVFGYKGKQVRDQIHSHDVINAFWNFAQNPRPGEVYNLGGGRENAASLLECIEMIAQASGGKRPALTYTETNRIGDHICYYSDLRKFKQHYPGWSLSYSLPRIVEEMVRLISDNPARA
ncbi:MAG TPA: NAD-dependent epimerase/dehydratase family protein [Tepidisphaeraceae bacterium]|nr:NAD-dependent epimerase/dehydratase family protein [Tepidisphaeraceae bacterium]